MLTTLHSRNDPPVMCCGLHHVATWHGQTTHGLTQRQWDTPDATFIVAAAAGHFLEIVAAPFSGARARNTQSDP